MTAVLPQFVDQHQVARALGGYLDSVAAALGVGPEARTLDLDTPVSAYLAVDTRLPTHPDRDLALLWHEEHGWSAAIETHSGEDLIVVDHLDGLLPEPRAVARFVHALQADGPRHRSPVRLRAAGDHADLARLLSG